ncbi:hypothetical protein HX005_06265 [Acinetobacter sp. R933-2]|uniref:hypothetical protein n=1 Tax=Acinetobacter sp. R933-2 TaxID=2746728 RepID=UPI002575471D|nr:hypothetical protein [Acinetobacter sp. R933-2]MDM1246988.1 hypothetical protein [Acinetobacter sp. R933-2]
MIVAGGGAGSLFLIIFLLILMSLGSASFYFLWRCRYTRKGLLVPPLKKWQLFLLYSPIVLCVLFAALIFWAAQANEKYVKFEHEKDKNRYFTLEKDTPFGEIILPKGTHISKYIPAGFDHNAPRDLNDVDGIQFPYPVQINGMSVLEISPTIGFLRLAKDYHFIHQAKKMTCPKTHYLVVDLNNYQLELAYRDKNLPIPPLTFKPSLWTFQDCMSKIDFPSSLPHWKDGKLISAR